MFAIIVFLAQHLNVLAVWNDGRWETSKNISLALIICLRVLVIARVFGSSHTCCWAEKSTIPWRLHLCFSWGCLSKRRLSKEVFKLRTHTTRWTNIWRHSATRVSLFCYTVPCDKHICKISLFVSHHILWIATQHNPIQYDSTQHNASHATVTTQRGSFVFPQSVMWCTVSCRLLYNRHSFQTSDQCSWEFHVLAKFILRSMFQLRHDVEYEKEYENILEVLF